MLIFFFLVNCVRIVKHFVLNELTAANLSSVCVCVCGGGVNEKVRGEPSACVKSVAEWRWTRVASGSSWHAAYLHVTLADCAHLFKYILWRKKEGGVKGRKRCELAFRSCCLDQTGSFFLNWSRVGGCPRPYSGVPARSWGSGSPPAPRFWALSWTGQDSRFSWQTQRRPSDKCRECKQNCDQNSVRLILVSSCLREVWRS